MQQGFLRIYSFLRFRFAALRFCVLVVRRRFLVVFFFICLQPLDGGPRNAAAS